MENRPLVSVCIPCYNAEKTIAATLDSILAQTYANIEIIVSDNQSTDKTRDVVRSYESKGVKLVENPPVVEGDGRIFGAFDNWDYALSQGQGEFLCLYHADDLYDPEIIEKEVCFLLSHTSCGIVFSLSRAIDGDGNSIRLPKYRRMTVFEGNKSYDYDSFLENILRYKHFISTPTLMLRKEVSVSIGDFNERDYNSAADLDYFMRVSKKYNVGVVNELLHDYRLTEHHITAQINKNRTTIEDYFIVMDNYLNSGENNNIEKARLYYYEMHLKNDMARCAWYLLLKGRLGESKKMLDSVMCLRWAGYCLRSFHRVKILGAACLMTVLLSVNFYYVKSTS